MKPQRLVTVLALSALLAAAPARAGILADMTQLFMSNSTASSTLSTANRMGAFGGSFEMRAPTTSVNLVSFDPPRVDAGCGGIDLYGGSFTFINGQQLVAIFRAVAANAVGLAFKAAINAISPSLGQLMTEFHNLLQTMNNLGKNSCQMANLVVKDSEQALGLQVNANGAIGTANAGMFSDAMGALNGYLTSANSYLQQAGEVNAKAGNTNVKAILNSGSSAIMGLAGIGNYDGSTDNPSDPNSLNNRVLISIMGFEVSGVPCQNTNQASTPDTTASTTNPTLGTVTCSGAPTLTLQDLIDGGGTGSPNPSTPLVLYQCANPSGYGTPDSGGFDPQVCTQMQTTNYNYPGIRAFVNTALFGSVDAASSVTSTSILGQLNAGTSVNLTGSQYQFLNTTGLPLIPLLAKTSDPGTRVAIAQRLAEQVVSCVAAAVGETIYKAALGTQNGGENNLSQDTKRNIDHLRVDYVRERGVCLNYIKVLQTMQELNEATRLVAGNVR